jgi:murein DD-endopeptidase MepM/ murein hydrolase activator NlpD
MRLARASLASLLTAALVAGACGRAPESGGSGPARDILLPVNGQSVDAKVPPNATLETLLRAHDLPQDVIGVVLTVVRQVFNPRHLRAHQSYRITRTLDGLFREFQYQIDADRLLRVHTEADHADVKAEVITMPREYVTEALVVEIGKGESLVGVLEAHGENVLLALELANIYGGEVDFNSDLQPGDRLEVMFDRALRHGEPVGYGPVRAAILENEGRVLHAVRFEDGSDQPAYYDDEGRSLRRQFLKSPLPFDPRVTSRFSRRRLHPVHRTYRAHLGVDYGAPHGTPVKAVASGVVDFVGTNGEAGRMVRIRHAGGYQTAYLHLSAYAPGLRAGARVAQGDLIGKVGSTGTATGPHLDYRIIKNGQYVDPIAEMKRMPKGDPIDASRLSAFVLQRDDALDLMKTLVAALPVAPSSSLPSSR